LVSGPDGVASIDMPAGIVVDPAVWKPATPDAPYPIKRIEEFRDRIYLLTDHNEIIILSSTSLEPVDTITWSVLSGPAFDIAFANATTAYMTLSANLVAVVDLTVGEITSMIDVKGRPAEIAVVGNQLCVAVPENNEAKIIDTRTNAVEATLPIPTAFPTYVA
jgi:DNA-binding beta-propeller fold protein YncE